MAIKSKQPPARPSDLGETVAPSPMEKALEARARASKTLAQGHAPAEVETIEARLERKAAVADTQTLSGNSLGQMTREQRHRLLYGD
jgi:hypothetical protein